MVYDGSCKNILLGNRPPTISFTANTNFLLLLHLKKDTSVFLLLLRLKKDTSTLLLLQ
jgi:hypothetical protein